MKRIAAALAFAAAIAPITTHAEIGTTKGQIRDDRHCQEVGVSLERHGLSVREARALEHMNCAKVNGRWLSTKVYAA